METSIKRHLLPCKPIIMLRLTAIHPSRDTSPCRPVLAYTARIVERQSYQNHLKWYRKCNYTSELCTRRIQGQQTWDLQFYKNNLTLQRVNTQKLSRLVLGSNLCQGKRSAECYRGFPQYLYTNAGIHFYQAMKFRRYVIYILTAP